MGLLTGKNGIIVGASQGIGLGIAKKFVQEGANIIMTARSKDKLEAACAEVNAAEGASGKAIAMTGDLQSAEDAARIFKAVVDTWGRVDFLVNNAAIGEMQTLEAVDIDRIDSILLTNIKGPMVYCKEALKYMIEQNSGGILNVSSINGIRPLCGIVYSSSKGGVNSLIKAVAKEGGPYNVYCCGVCPAYTKTAITAGMDMDRHNRILSQIPLGRPAEPQEIANLILFYASDLASFVTGEVGNADGGLRMD